jgi:MerR family mercuric resistance operon transcriptional regulator
MMRISELARKGGVGVETVRFYQRKGLLTVPRGEAPGAISAMRRLPASPSPRSPS